MKNAQIRVATGGSLPVSHQMIAATLAVVVAVALPQLFHVLGRLSGTGTVPGSIFSPMHLPVIFVGLLAGPLAGGVSGLLSPLMSHLMSGMPGTPMVPLMMAELVGYGLAAGLLRNRTLPCIVKVLVAQVAGRLVYALAILVAVHFFGRTNFSVASILPSVVVGLPGLLLQWVFIPLVLYRLQGQK